MPGHPLPPFKDRSTSRLKFDVVMCSCMGLVFACGGIAIFVIGARNAWMERTVISCVALILSLVFAKDAKECMRELRSQHQ